MQAHFWYEDASATLQTTLDILVKDQQALRRLMPRTYTKMVGYAACKCFAQKAANEETCTRQILRPRSSLIDSPYASGTMLAIPMSDRAISRHQDSAIRPTNGYLSIYEGLETPQERRRQRRHTSETRPCKQSLPLLDRMQGLLSNLVVQPTNVECFWQEVERQHKECTGHNGHELECPAPSEGFDKRSS
jgi:hypothetical protein